ncbi:MAG: hypothetical protein ACR2JW_06760 [Thermomicrobiales bacterium]
MKKHSQPSERAARWYALLVRLYPGDHRRAFGAQMLQTFKDQYRDASEQRGEAAFAFWLAVVGDALTGSIKEQSMSVRTRRILPMVMLIIVAILLAGIAVILSQGTSLAFTVIIPIVMLGVTYVVVKHSPHTSASSPRRHVWIEYGLRTGVPFGILWIAFNLASNLATYGSPLYSTSRSIAAVLFTLGMPVAFGLVGFITGRKSRATSDGAFAGLLAAGISAAIAVVSLVVIMLLFWDTVRANAFQDPGMIGDWHQSGDATFGRFLWDDNLGAAFFMTLFSLIFGGLLGAIGGALGAAPPRNGHGAGVEMAAPGGGTG